MTPRDGIYRAVPYLEYEEWEALRASTLTEGHRSMAHLYYSLRHPNYRTTPALDFGDMVHAVLLEPERYLEQYVVSPAFDRRTKAGKEGAAEFAEANRDKRVVLEKDKERADGIYLAMQESTAAQALLREGRGSNELSILWTDDGIRRKARIDRVRADYPEKGETAVVDLKTTRDASPDAFAKSIANYRYHNKAAWYLDALEAMGGSRPRRYFLVAVESDPPHGIAIYELCEGAIQQGREENARVLRQYVQCLASGHWPGYADVVTPIDLPRWAREVQA